MKPHPACFAPADVGVASVGRAVVGVAAVGAEVVGVATVGEAGVSVASGNGDLTTKTVAELTQLYGENTITVAELAHTLRGKMTALTAPTNEKEARWHAEKKMATGTDLS